MQSFLSTDYCNRGTPRKNKFCDDLALVVSSGADRTHVFQVGTVEELPNVANDGSDGMTGSMTDILIVLIDG